MISIVRLVLLQFHAWLRSRADIRAENMMLRHQLDMLLRPSRKRARTTRVDRLWFVWLYRLWPRSAQAMMIVHPKTLIRWHREGFRLYWRWKSRRRGGRPRVSTEIRQLVRQMSRENPLWGAPRIHGELLKLGFDASQSTVSRYMPRRPPDPGQRWMTFLANHRDCIAAVDFLTVPTLFFRQLYVLVVLNHQRRRLVYMAVTANPTAFWTIQQMREAFPWEGAPRYVIHDRHGTFGEAFRRSLQLLGMTSVPTAPRSPWQNGHVERVIGSIRRECLDHMIILNAKHLRRVLKDYLVYYNETRTHLALSKDAPVPRATSPPHEGNVIAVPQVGGLHHRYERCAA